MKLLIAPDKFKGSLSAAGVANAIERGWSRANPSARFQRAPIADGGEGFCEAFFQSLGGHWNELESLDALGRSIRARYLFLPETGAAFIEMSESSGLWRIQAAERDPYRANTFGTGILMRHAIESGASMIFVGLGGSATTDGGIGMAAALGFEFLSREGVFLEPIPANLPVIASIRIPAGREGFPEIVAACDVQNPLLGPRGTAEVYSPQKGADPNAVRFLEAGLANLSRRVAETLGRDWSMEPGAGAAGGIAYGLLAFCGARLEPGFELVSRAVGLEGRIAAADVVITGEGRIDEQTLEGKGPAGVAAMARAMGKRVIAFGGSIADDPSVLERFDAVVPIVDRPMTLPEAMQDVRTLLERAAERTARLLTLL